MKAIQFTIPVSHDKTIIIEEYSGSYFYPFLHRHNEIQLMWVMEGEGTLIADCNMHSFKKNDIFLLGANQPHVFKNNSDYFISESDKIVKGISIFFNPNGALSSVFQLPELSQLEMFFRNHQGGFKVPFEYRSSVSNKINLLKNASGVDRMMHFFSILKMLYSISSPKDHSLSNVSIENFTEKKGQRIGMIYDYILRNYENDLTLEEVAEYACLTTPAFCRYFKKHTGKTFIAFLNQLRIHEACKKLADKNEYQISDIAYKSGFNSITNFNRVFKSVRGISPKEYMNDIWKRN